MTINFENVLYLVGAAGATTKRTPAQRGTDFINVMDYGAKGDNSTNDTTAIRAAINTAANWVSPGGSVVHGTTVYFPAGIYLCNPAGGDAADQALFDLSGTNNTVRIVGAGKNATQINGTSPNGFVFDQQYGQNGCTEISHMAITNNSPNIGSGAIRLIQTGSEALLIGLSLTGMVCLDTGYFMSTVIDIDVACPSGASPPNYGSYGVHLAGGNIIGLNASRAGPYICVISGGNTGSSIIGCRTEESVIGIRLGQRIGIGSLCTISGSVLTVTSAAHLNPSVESFGVATFTPSSQILGTGIPATTFVQITNQLTQTNGDSPGGRGTYQLNVSPGNISTPVPMVCLNASQAQSTEIANLETEGCSIGIDLQDVQGCSILNAHITSDLAEAATIYGSKTGTPLCGMRLFKAVGTTISNVFMQQNCSVASFMFEENTVGFEPSFNCLTFQDCISNYSGSVTTTTTAFIDSGTAFPSHSGTAGTVLCLPTGSFTDPINMKVGIGGIVSWPGSPTGVNAPYIDHGFSDNTTEYPSGQYAQPVGTGGFALGNGGHEGSTSSLFVIGKYRLICPAGPVNITGQPITITHGQAWGQSVTPNNVRLPISNLVGTTKAGIQIVNCDYVNSHSLLMNYADLPNSGFPQDPDNTQVQLEGMQYDIADSTIAATGNFYVPVTSGGGSNRVTVRLASLISFTASYNDGTKILNVTSISGTMKVGMQIVDRAGGGGGTTDNIQVNANLIVQTFLSGGTSGNGGTGTYLLTGSNGGTNVASESMRGALWVIV